MILNTRTGRLWLLSSVLLQIAAFLMICQYYNTNHYLPAPFVYDKFDTFMDLYNSMWWAVEDGKYSVWGAIYPPLTFVLLSPLKLLATNGALISGGVELRNFTLFPAYILIFLHLMIPALVLVSPIWSKIKCGIKVLVYIAYILSGPLLFSMERANVIILAVGLLALCFSYPGIIRVIAIALLINLKPYFALMLLPYLLSGKFDRFLQTTALAGGIFLLTGLASDLNFLLFFQNLLVYSGGGILSGREVLALPSSISAYSYVASLSADNARSINSDISTVYALSALVELVKWSVIAVFLAGLASSQKAVNLQFVAIIVLIINLGIWTGGYTQIFYLVVIPTIVQLRFKKIYLLLIFTIFLPLDGITILTQQLGQKFSYLGGQMVDVEYNLGLGIFRPLLNFSILVFMAVEFIAPVIQPFWQILQRKTTA